MSRPEQTARPLLSLILFLTIACAAPSARADGASEARQRYERAVKLYEDGVYDAALVEFTRAYELNPSFKLLYNIGQVRVAMQDYAGAVDAFQQYLREGGGQIPEARVEALRKELARLEQRVARIAVHSDIDGAEVLIDDLVVGTTPLATPALVNSGVRRVTVRHPEYLSQTQRVSVAGGEQRKVVLYLGGPASARAPAAQASEAAAAPTSPPSASSSAPPPTQLSIAPTEFEDEPKSARPKRGAAVWSAWSVTAALALSAVGVGAAAKVKDHSLDELRHERLQGVGASGPYDRSEELHELTHKVERLALATDVLLGTAVVAAGVSLWLTLRGRSPKAESRAQLSIHPRGFRLGAEF